MMMTNRVFAAAALFTGIAAPVLFAASQTEPQINAPGAFFYSQAGRSYLGVDIQDVTADRVSALKLKEERGVEVTTVDQDAPAGKAGVKEHDVILEFNGAPVESEEQLRRLIRETPPGRTVTLGVSRDGNPLKISVQLGDRAKIIADSMPKIMGPKGPKIVVPKMPNGPIPPDQPNFFYQFQTQTYSSLLGIQTENLGHQLGEFFGVKDGEGVLIRSVEKGSPAEKAGLKAGDVIVKADNEKLSDRADLAHILRNHREGGKVSLGIIRDKHEQTVTVELPARNSRGSWWDDSNSESEAIWGDLENLELEESDFEGIEQMVKLPTKEQMEKVREQVRAIQPQIAKAMREAERQLKQSEKLWKQQEKALQLQMNNLI